MCKNHFRLVAQKGFLFFKIWYVNFLQNDQMHYFLKFRYNIFIFHKDILVFSFFSQASFFVLCWDVTQEAVHPMPCRQFILFDVFKWDIDGTLPEMACWVSTWVLTTKKYGHNASHFNVPYHFSISNL